VDRLCQYNVYSQSCYPFYFIPFVLGTRSLSVDMTFMSCEYFFIIVFPLQCSFENCEFSKLTSVQTLDLKQAATGVSLRLDVVQRNSLLNTSLFKILLFCFPCFESALCSYEE